MNKDESLQKLEEFVCDEDKIVTVPWLCTTLAITAKDAKELLNQYINTSRKSQPGTLSVLYLLSGLREGILTISLAKEDEVDDKKDLYSKEPIVEVYSIQKSKEIDLNGIALVDYFNTNSSSKPPILGSIISKNCIKRNFKPKKSLPLPPAPTVKEKTSFFTKLPPKSTINNGTTSTNNSLPASKTSNAKVTQSPKHSAFDRFFANGEQKPVKKETVTPTTKATEKSPFDRFFANGDQKSVKKDTPKKPTEDTKSNSQKTLSSLVDSDSDSESVPQRQTAKSNGKEKQTKRPAKKKSSATKRRKRIVVEEESDDDIFANDDDDEDEEEMSRKRKNVITDSDEEQTVIKTEPIPELPKNKKRKLVDRTFQDEEGFIITKKEWIEEDASGDDEVKVTEVKTEPQVKKEINNTNEEKTKKNISPKNEKNGKVQGAKGKKAVPTNQTTLMSFFKKK